MTFQDSFKDLVPGSTPPPPPPRWQKPVRIALIVLSITTGLLLVIRLVQMMDIVPSVAGTGSGTVAGQVVDQAGRPQPAEVIIQTTDLIVQTAPDGRFQIAGVPAGAQVLVVARDGVAVEYPITVRNGQTINVGTVKSETTTQPVR
ncbi:carboxypeptidase-like regulatory domain-containing protein [Candidatus Chloroploca sp. Khr17]|uniref:carboxypeptidase-like regulatory domain-containing protein n=1 Tax=Candidatus Chloroploca sp. Khr17 TaxID=2496869 RepID=UPI0013E9DFCB|nr:carboxypeptidase-like regulatory domain-containing protein [Candidatus Chloroploca sp. Khr17]